MALQKLKFKPGFIRDVTDYTSEGSWRDGDKVRFNFGSPESIGGWTRFTTLPMLGTVRGMCTFNTLTGTYYTAAGSELKLYIVSGSEPQDITPIRLTSGVGDATFSATTGSDAITVTETAHGAAINDFVTFSGAVSLGGAITADVLNIEYQITSVPDGNTFTIQTAIAANASDTGNGGASTVAAYQINTGLDSATVGNGWGAGVWSRGTWGSAADTSIAGDRLRLWSMDNFGEDLIANIRGGGIYYWDSSAGTAARAVNITSLAGSAQPQIVNIVLVSERDRHVLAFGCDTEAAPGVLDPMVVRFSSQESFTVWNTSSVTTAGELRVGSGSEIIAAIQTKQQVVIFTDRSVSAMQYIGAPFTFGLTEVATNVSIVSQNSPVALGDHVYWMGNESFYRYDGNVQSLPCPVKEYVFSNINQEQQSKIVGASNSKFNEIWWFYPSGSSEVNDSYVVYNYVENTWYYGTLERSAWRDASQTAYPIAASTDGYLYYHENGITDGSTNPPSPINSYIESSVIELGDGDQFMFLSRVIPDLTFRNSVNGPLATFTISAQDYPGASFDQSNSGVAVRTATAPIEQYTEQLFFRLRGRAMSLKVGSNDVNTEWRLGTPRADVRLDGRR